MPRGSLYFSKAFDTSFVFFWFKINCLQILSRVPKFSFLIIEWLILVSKNLIVTKDEGFSYFLIRYLESRVRVCVGVCVWKKYHASRKMCLSYVMCSFSNSYFFLTSNPLSLSLQGKKGNWVRESSRLGQCTTGCKAPSGPSCRQAKREGIEGREVRGIVWELSGRTWDKKSNEL